jgi:hypothetical protein
MKEYLVMRMIPMPAPNRTNKANAWIVPMRIGETTAMALDQAPSRRTVGPRLGPDLTDPLKNGEASDDESNGNARERLLRLIAQRLNGGSDQEVASLLERLGSGATGEQRPGPSRRGDQLRHQHDEEHDDDPCIDNLKQFLASKGLGDRDVRSACDLARAWRRGDQELGINRSARFGGSFGGNQGGALHGERSQPDLQPLTDPGAKDFMTYEESVGCEPARPRGDRGMRRGLAGDRRSPDFATLYGLEPVRQQMNRRPARGLALDGASAAQVESFYSRFPTAKRLGVSY